MKYLQTLCEQADVQLTLKYYYPYLNALEESLLREAVRKQSAQYALHLLKALSLQILFLLQHSSCLWGESHWQSLLTQSQSALGNRHPLTSQHYRRALQQANEVISTASVTEAVRQKIWSEVKDRAVLSDLQAQRYESARQTCLTRQAALNKLDSAVNTTLHDYHQLIEYVSPLNQSIPSVRPDSPELAQSLRPYDAKMTQVRLSTEHIHHQIQCEGNARLVYHSLTRELGQPSVAEKMAESVEKAKGCLQRRSEHMAEKTDHYRRQVTQQVRFAIEHRTQLTLAHAHRMENIAVLLATLIQSVQSHGASRCQPLLGLLAEAQAMQKALQENSDRVTLQERLLTLNTHRCAYEKSITSFWGTLFIQPRQLQSQQQLNHRLQTTLADLVTPICAFDDKNKAIPSDTIKKLKITSDKLAVHQGHLVQEQEKINQIENIFSA
jgi:hypothetical protein